MRKKRKQGYQLRNLFAGVISGAIGGMLFPLIYITANMAPCFGLLFGNLPGITAFGIHFGISAVTGGFFAILFQDIIQDHLANSIMAGIVYALFIFLTIHMWVFPSFQPNGVHELWTQYPFNQIAPFILGHIIFGIILGALYPWFHKIVRYYD